jgi:hypothetical protein
VLLLSFYTRCMLKRISAILTAPPKITDAEYKAMKKLCPTLRGIIDFALF